MLVRGVTEHSALEDDSLFPCHYVYARFQRGSVGTAFLPSRLMPRVPGPTALFPCAAVAKIMSREGCAKHSLQLNS